MRAGLRSRVLAGACAIAVFAGGFAVAALASNDSAAKVTTSPRPSDTRKLAEPLTGTTKAPRLANLSSGITLSELRKEPVANPSTPTATPGSTAPATNTEPVCC